jgi:hypothetical protein
MGILNTDGEKQNLTRVAIVPYKYRFLSVLKRKSIRMNSTFVEKRNGHFITIYICCSLLG